MLTFEDVKNNAAIRTYIQRADESLIALGFTEHSFAHVTMVAENAAYILETLGYPARTVELTRIAAFLHDIGNLVNRVDELFDQVKQELIDMIASDAAWGQQGLDLLMVAKYLERIGDHATNVAEWVEYSITGVHPSNN